ncbi:MAG: hypothetical protein JSR95_19325, partial [Proteobacteria bacterium]|nr:hypothetical protein [Pseudomonadota bacterium]
EAGLVGGVAARITGGKFDDGFTVAAAGYLFNSAAHKWIAPYKPGRNPYIAFSQNDDGTIESNVINVAYTSGVGPDAAAAYFDQITDDYAAKGIILRFNIVGEADHLLAGVDILLGTCGSAPGSCGEAGMGEAETGGRRIWYSPTQMPTVPDHEFGHILGLDDSTSGIMGPAGGRITNSDASAIKNCYMKDRC